MAQMRRHQAVGWDGWAEDVAHVLAEATTPAARAQALAARLAERLPETTVGGCSLDGEARLVWKDPDAQARWSAEVNKALRTLEMGPAEVRSQTLGEGQQGLSLLTARVAGPTADRSWLLIGAESLSPTTRAGFGLATATLGLHLDLEATRLQKECLRREAGELEGFLTAGEAMGSLIHDLNNSLNSIVLQAAVVQMKVPEEMRDALAAIRREGVNAAARVRPLQQVRQQWRADGIRIPLREAMSEALRDQGTDCTFRFEGEEPVSLAANSTVFKRLILLVLRALGRPPSVRVAVRCPEGHLHVSMASSAVTEPGEPVDVELCPPDGVELLDWLAIRSQARLLDATLHVLRHAEGLEFRLEWALPREDRPSRA